VWRKSEHILYSVTFYENRAFYEIMCKNMVEPDRPQMTIQCRKDAIWIPDNEGKNIDTQS